MLIPSGRCNRSHDSFYNLYSALYLYSYLSIYPYAMPCLCMVLIRTWLCIGNQSLLKTKVKMDKKTKKKMCRLITLSIPGSGLLSPDVLIWNWNSFFLVSLIIIRVKFNLTTLVEHTIMTEFFIDLLLILIQCRKIRLNIYLLLLKKGLSGLICTRRFAFLSASPSFCKIFVNLSALESVSAVQ